jgi:acyl carrier protein
VTLLSTSEANGVPASAIHEGLGLHSLEDYGGFTLVTDEVYQKTAQALAEVLGVDEEGVAPTLKLVGDLEATSLDVVDLMFQLKRIFRIEITLAEAQRELGGNGAAAGEGGQGFDDAVFESVTVQDLANWVRSRLPG